MANIGANKTFEEIFTPFTSEEIRVFNPRHIKFQRYLKHIKPLIHDNGDGTVDIMDDFDCNEFNLLSLEDIGLKIRRVHGSFYCFSNRLANLRGAPLIVDGSFVCRNNRLESLEGFPQFVGKSIDISCNYLRNFVGMPRHVKGNFDFMSNRIDSMEGFPEVVEGSVISGNTKILLAEPGVRALCAVGGKVLI